MTQIAAANLLGVSLATLQRLVKSGKLPNLERETVENYQYRDGRSPVVKKVPISLNLDPSTLEMLDDLRGPQSRGEFITEALQAYVGATTTEEN